MQLQLKHLPFVFLVVAAICLTGALTAASNTSPDQPTHRSARQ